MTVVVGRGSPTSETRAVPRARPRRPERDGHGRGRSSPSCSVPPERVAPLPALIVLSGAGVVLLAIAAPRTMAGLTALAVLFVRPLSTSCSLPR